MNCRSRASRSESITALKTKHNYLDSGVNRLCSDGKMIPVQIQKQTDPNSKHEKYPAIKCPLCRKFLYAVPNKNTRDLMLVYNLKDKRYSSFSPDYVLRCPRCHVTLGIFYRLSNRKIWAADSGWKARIISIEYGGDRQKLKNAIAEDRLCLPSFDCPNPKCTAKNIAFAVSREAKNESELIPLEFISENTPADFAVVCPKCKRRYILFRHKKSPIIPLYNLPLYGCIAT